MQVCAHLSVSSVLGVCWQKDAASLSSFPAQSNSLRACAEMFLVALFEDATALMSCRFVKHVQILAFSQHSSGAACADVSC